MRLPDLTILQNRDFVRLLASRACAVFAGQIQMIAMVTLAPTIVLRLGGTVSEAAFALGLIGLLQFLPLLALSLFGGHVADRHDRKAILLVCYVGKLVIAVALAATAAFADEKTLLTVLYAAAAAVGAINAFQPAAQQALLPMIVPRHDIPRAIPLNSLAFTVGTIVGPGLGGLMLGYGGRVGPELTFGATALLVCVTLVGILGIRVTPSAAPAADQTAIAQIKQGLAYVWNNKIVLGAISLDLVVVLLAGAQALVPFFAVQILGTDEVGSGWLRGAFAMGAAGTALMSALVPISRNVGRWMFGATFVFALALIGFGLSRSYWLSFALLLIAGAADMISVQVRQNLIQLATPAMMLGRVAAVSFVFVSASNELGDFETGVVTAAFGLTNGVVIGGVAALLAALLWTRLFPGLAGAYSYEDQALTKAREAETNAA